MFLRVLDVDGAALPSPERSPLRGLQNVQNQRHEEQLARVGQALSRLESQQVGYLSGETDDRRVPLLEVVDRMDLTNMTIELAIRGAYSKGGIPLTVQGVANIKVPGEEPTVAPSISTVTPPTRRRISSNSSFGARTPVSKPLISSSTASMFG